MMIGTNTDFRMSKLYPLMLWIGRLGTTDTLKFLL